MAKRKKIEEDEIQLPKFDAKEYFRREKEITKLYIIFSILAIILGVLSAILQIYGLVYVSPILGLGAIFFFIYFSDTLFHVDLNLKDKIGPIFVLFMLYLSTWILALNAPFADISPPSIDGVYYYKNGTWEKCEYYQGVYFVNSTEENVKIGFKVYDASSVKVRIIVDGKDYGVKKSEIESVYYITLSSSQLTGTWLDIRVIAEDSKGNTKSSTYLVSIKPSKVIF